jgi:hypothetical protein
MNLLLSDETPRDPFRLYEQMRRNPPVLHVPPPFDKWTVFDYDTARCR